MQLAKLFALNVMKELDARNWSQQRLSRESGVNDNFLNGLMTGKRSCSLLTVEKICTALGVPAVKLLDEAFISTSAYEPRRRNGPRMKGPIHVAVH